MYSHLQHNYLSEYPRTIRIEDCGIFELNMHSLFQGLLKPWLAGVFSSSEKLGPVLSVVPRHTFVNETFASEFTQPFNKSSRDKRKSVIRASASRIDYSRVLDFGICFLVSNVDLHF